MMLELRNVSKSYRSIPAVEDVSFVLNEGEVLGYLGPNGSGKSTTVKMVIGMIQPTKGKVLFDGRNIHDDLGVVSSAAWICARRGAGVHASFGDGVSAAHRAVAGDAGERD